MSTTAKVPIPDKARKEIKFVLMHKIVRKIEREVLHTSVFGSKCRPNPLKICSCWLLHISFEEFEKGFPY